jgi:transcriptional regulator with XRE-family HTH domain
MPSISSALAGVLRRHRTEQGLSQEELAHRADLDRTYISLVERSKRNITVDALDRIAIGLALPASKLVAEAEAARQKGRR